MYKKPFVISKKKGETFIKYYTGKVLSYENLAEIDENIEQIFVCPFSLAKEKGFEVHPSDKKIVSILVEQKKEFSFEDFQKTFEEENLALDGEIQDFFSKKEYEKIVEDVIEKEIGNGEGSNFCIAGKFSGKIKDFSTQKALSIFKKLFLGEYGSYLHFLFFDGKEFFIGASPERNVSIEKNIVRMNPISGTFRKAGYSNYLDFKKDFLVFLDDKKEINELFMCIDEELKMMSKICSSGGMVVGPILKEMANLVHTEYLLSGETKMKKLDVFRESIWACTLVGSPLESGFKIIKKYENFDRKYYAGAICHLEKDSLDSSIMIRTVNIDLEGNFEILAGASIVKDSKGENEYFETKVKSKGLLDAIIGEIKQKKSFLENYYLDDEVQELIQKRNQNLSKVWFFKQNFENISKRKEKILIINNEDDFTNMIAHLLKMIGFEVILKKYFEVKNSDLVENDLVLVGPGPGNPGDESKKTLKNLEIIDFLEKNQKKFFGICLGHQLICRYFGIKLQKKVVPTQGEQIEIDLFGKKEKLGFYNTFAGFFEKEKIPSKKIIFAKNQETGEIFAMKGENFFSFQFHPESILSQNGLEILSCNLEKLLKN